MKEYVNSPENNNFPIIDEFNIVECIMDLQHQREQNLYLTNLLNNNKNHSNDLNDRLIDLERLNKKLTQDLEYEAIQTNNFRSINSRLNIALKNLESNKSYIKKLLFKKKMANYKINKLINVIKNLQNVIKNKNLIIKKINSNYRSVCYLTNIFTEQHQ